MFCLFVLYVVIVCVVCCCVVVVVWFLFALFDYLRLLGFVVLSRLLLCVVAFVIGVVCLLFVFCSFVVVCAMCVSF